MNLRIIYINIIIYNFKYASSWEHDAYRTHDLLVCVDNSTSVVNTKLLVEKFELVVKVVWKVIKLPSCIESYSRCWYTWYVYVPSGAIE